MANVELLNQVVDYTVNSDNWYQGLWYSYSPECGTAMCVAGFTAIMFGGYEPTGFIPKSQETNFVETEYGTERISEVAAYMLDLTTAEADELFSESVDSAKELRETADMIARGEIVDEMDHPSVLVDVSSINW